MQSFIDQETLSSARRKERRSALVLRVLCAAALAAAAAECLMTRTGNAARMLWVFYITLLGAGLAVIVLYTVFLRPARCRVAHLEGLMGREPGEREGRLSLSGEPFRIPKSVPVRIALLDTGEETLRLNLDEAWVPLAPPDGARVRIRTVGRFITGIQPLDGSLSRAAAGRRFPVRGGLRSLGTILPAFLLWGMMVLVIGGFVFSRITDAPRGNKIVLFADAELRSAPELAEKMEKALPEPIRAVKVHPFSYALMNSAALRQADLYIVPASHVREYRDWFAPLPASLAGLAAPEEHSGIPVYDPVSGLACAEEWICYESAGGEPEPWYLFFGGASVHLDDGTAERAAELLLSMDSEKEESP